MKNLSQINENNDIITKEYLEEEGNAATSKAFIMQDIPEGSDLNDFLTPGFYGTRTTTIAGSILNSPLKTAFSLLVMYSYNSNTTNSRIVQIINNYSDKQPKTYMRNIYAGSFGKWEKIIIESDLISALTGYLPIDGNAVTASKLKVSNIPNNSDLNNYKSSGIYAIISSSYTIANKPGTRAGVLHVSNTENSSPLAFQVFFEYSSNTNPCKIYYRGYYTTQDVWTEWASSANKEELPIVMSGATTSSAGKSGLVPAPAAGSATRYLRSDGTWQVPPNTTYTLSSFGITATAAELNKLDGAKVTVSEINYLDGVEYNIQNQLDLSYWLGLTNNTRMLFFDPIFRYGDNSVVKYVNSGVTNVSTSRISAPSGTPTTSQYVMEMKNIGTSAPGLGGFVQSIASRANATFVIKYLIKAPVGYKLMLTSNSMGSGYIDKWLTSNDGIGDWKWYVRLIQCGSTGSFLSGGHVYLRGSYGTPESPVVWYLGAIYTYDVTDNSRLPGAVSTIEIDNLTASRALVSNSSGKVAVSAITSTELGYLDGLESNVQDQIDNKVIALTQSQYNALTTKAADTLYCIYEE